MVLNACISGHLFHKRVKEKKKCFDSCLHTLMSSSGSVELWKKIIIVMSSNTAPWAWHSSVSTFSSSSPLKMMNWLVKHADPTDSRTRLASRSQHPRPGQSHAYFGCHCEIPIEEAKSINLMFTTFNHLQIVQVGSSLYEICGGLMAHSVKGSEIYARHYQGCSHCNTNQ